MEHNNEARNNCRYSMRPFTSIYRGTGDNDIYIYICIQMNQDNYSPGSINEREMGGRVVLLLTDHLEITDLALHRICIYLTHVPAPIGFSHLPDVKEPRPVIAVRNRDPVILRDHVARYRQNSLRVDAQPCHLKSKAK